MGKFQFPSTEPNVSEKIGQGTTESIVIKIDKQFPSDPLLIEQMSKSICQTLAYIDNHPWKAIGWQLLPFSSRFCPYNQDIYKLLREFIHLGLDNIDTNNDKEQFNLITSLNYYIQALERSKLGDKRDKVICIAFMDKLYEIFDVLVSNGLEDTHPGKAKIIKKHLHHLAEHYQIANAKRIINLRKLYQKLQKEYAGRDRSTRMERTKDWWYGKKRDTFPHEKYPHIEAMLAGGIYAQTYTLVDHLDSKNLTADEIKAITEGQRPTPPHMKKVSKRKWKKFILSLAFLSTIIPAIGEGVYAMAMFGFVSIFPILLAIGIGSFLLKYLLFHSSCQETLKKLFLGRLFKDKDGNSVSLIKKIIISTLLPIGITGAIVGSYLSFSTTSTALAATFAAIGIIAPSALIFSLASIIAVVSAAALACSISAFIADVVSNERHKDVFHYGKELFMLPGYKTASFSQWAAHITKVVANLLLLSAMTLIFSIAFILTAGLCQPKELFFLKINSWLSLPDKDLASAAASVSNKAGAIGIKSISEGKSLGSKATQMYITESCRRTAIKLLKDEKVKTKMGEKVEYTYNSIQTVQQQLAYNRAAIRKKGIYSAFPSPKEGGVSTLSMFQHENPHADLKSCDSITLNA